MSNVCGKAAAVSQALQMMRDLEPEYVPPSAKRIMQDAGNALKQNLQSDPEYIMNKSEFAVFNYLIFFDGRGFEPKVVKRATRKERGGSNNRSYVAKPVVPFLYDQAFKLREDLEFSPFVRLPVDGSDIDSTLIFQHYTEDFLSFMQSGSVSRLQVKRILSDILKGITACHSKDWVHCDVKPNNVMISYTTGPDGARDIHGVSLSDTEEAAKVESGEAIFAQVGNILWRSPEAQTGICVGKASDVWSFGVTAVYGITKMVIFAYDKLEEGVLPEAEVLSNMLSYFGPLSRGLMEHLKDSPWCDVLSTLDQSFDESNPRKLFSLWRDIEGLEADDKEFFGRILRLDPGLRPSAEALLEDKWFISP